MTDASNDGRIDYIEFSVGDIARAREFYGTAPSTASSTTAA
jgi:hypothetical protein